MSNIKNKLKNIISLAQLHFVNWNCSLFQTPDEASKSNENDGLLVMAAFVKIGKVNEEFEKLVECLDYIHLKNQNTPVDHIDIRNLLPGM